MKWANVSMHLLVNSKNRKLIYNNPKVSILNTKRNNIHAESDSKIQKQPPDVFYKKCCS